MLAILLGYVFGFGGPLVVLLTVCQSESISVFEKVYPELLKRLDDSNDKIRVAVCEASTWFQQLWQLLLLLQQALDVFFKCLPQNWSRTLYECPTCTYNAASSSRLQCRNFAGTSSAISSFTWMILTQRPFLDTWR